MVQTQQEVKHSLPDGYRLMPEGHVVSYIGWRQWGRRPGFGRMLVEVPNKDGYLYVRVRMPDGRREKRYLHKLIAWAYCGPRPNLAHEVRHLNGDQTDNSRENIAWGSRRDNALDRVAHGR